jgi:hypothetical protein
MCMRTTLVYASPFCSGPGFKCRQQLHMDCEYSLAKQFPMWFSFGCSLACPAWAILCTKSHVRTTHGRLNHDTR